LCSRQNLSVHEAEKEEKATEEGDDGLAQAGE
jgi:hypothetical protein